MSPFYARTKKPRQSDEAGQLHRRGRADLAQLAAVVSADGKQPIESKIAVSSLVTGRIS